MSPLAPCQAGRLHRGWHFASQDEPVGVAPVLLARVLSAAWFVQVHLVRGVSPAKGVIRTSSSVKRGWDEIFRFGIKPR